MSHGFEPLAIDSSCACTRFNDDFVFTYDDVVDQLLQLNARGCTVTFKERLPQSAWKRPMISGLYRQGGTECMGLSLASARTTFVAADEPRFESHF